MKVVGHVAERRRRRGARRVVDIGEDYARTLGEKAFGASTADASRGARYNGGSVLEFSFFHALPADGDQSGNVPPCSGSMTTEDSTTWRGRESANIPASTISRLVANEEGGRGASQATASSGEMSTRLGG